MDSTMQLLTLLVNLLAAGGMAFLLDDVPAWKNWGPRPAWLKTAANFLLTGLLIGVLTALSSVYQGETQLQTLISIAVNALAGYLVNQLTHQHDMSFQYRQQNAKELTYARFDTQTVGQAKIEALEQDYQQAKTRALGQFGQSPYAPEPENTRART